MPAKPKDSYQVPKTLGACADALYVTRQQRLIEQKDITAFEAIEKALKEHLIATLPKSDQTGAQGKLARVTVVTKKIPIVEDWWALYKYIKKTNQFDLLNRALNGAAVQERWDSGKTVPGVGSFNAVSVSVNKL
jgi:hypothetical protein